MVKVAVAWAPELLSALSWEVWVSPGGDLLLSESESEQPPRSGSAERAKARRLLGASCDIIPSGSRRRWRPVSPRTVAGSLLQAAPAVPRPPSRRWRAHAVRR